MEGYPINAQDFFYSNHLDAESFRAHARCCSYREAVICSEAAYSL